MHLVKKNISMISFENLAPMLLLSSAVRKTTVLGTKKFEGEGNLVNTYLENLPFNANTENIEINASVSAVQQ